MITTLDKKESEMAEITLSLLLDIEKNDLKTPPEIIRKWNENFEFIYHKCEEANYYSDFATFNVVCCR